MPIKIALGARAIACADRIIASAANDDDLNYEPGSIEHRDSKTKRGLWNVATTVASRCGLWIDWADFAPAWDLIGPQGLPGYAPNIAAARLALIRGLRPR